MVQSAPVRVCCAHVFVFSIGSQPQSYHDVAVGGDAVPASLVFHWVRIIYDILPHLGNENGMCDRYSTSAFGFVLSSRLYFIIFVASLSFLSIDLSL